MNADSLIIRNVRHFDLDAVLVLNQSEVPHVGSIDADRVRWYENNANYFRVAEAGDELAAYLADVPIRASDALVPAADVIPAAAVDALITEEGAAAEARG